MDRCSRFDAVQTSAKSTKETRSCEKDVVIRSSRLFFATFAASRFLRLALMHCATVFSYTPSPGGQLNTWRIHVAISAADTLWSAADGSAALPGPRNAATAAQHQRRCNRQPG